MSTTFLRGALRAAIGRGQQVDQLVAGGLHAQNDIGAPLSVIDQQNGAVEPAALIPANDSVPVVLFSQDYPTTVEAISFYGAEVFTAAAVALPRPTYHEDVFGVADATLIHGTVLVADITPVEELRQVTGDTITNAVEITGYMVALALSDRFLTTDAQGAVPATPAVVVSARCDGAIVHGRGLVYLGAGAIPNAQQVILDETDYTQAMADAGNVFTDGMGVVTRIVGLWGYQADRQ